MKDKKNIDEIFKNGLQDLEATPSPQVWKNIQAELDKEKSTRRVVPLWIKIGGVAALIALLLTVGNWAFDPFHLDSPRVTNDNPDRVNRDHYENTRGTQPSEETRIVLDESVEDHGKGNKSVPKKDFDPIRGDDSRLRGDGSNEPDKVKVADAKPKVENDGGLIEKADKNRDKPIAQVTSQTDVDEIERDQRASEVYPSEKQPSDKTLFDGSQETGIAKNESDLEGTDTKETSDNKIALEDAIAEQAKLKKNKEDTREEKKRRWEVTPNLAPVYYSGIGNGSSIDPEFNHNPQKGDINMSYGVQVSYALNDKLSLRTGVNNVDLGYSTSDIVIASGPVGVVGLDGVDYEARQIVLTAVSRASLNHAISDDFGELNLKSTSGDARLIQNISYYEIPLELKYAVLDSRFGINLIGGISTLFLGDNEISVRADDFNSVLGEANNLSDVSFSTNVGLGLNYKLSRRFVFNVEPMFKYQINPYTDSSVDFKPYYLGVYSGLSFKF